MNTLSKLIVLPLLTLFMFFGCDKDDNLQPDKNTLRISKIADNINMDDPIFVFEYDEDGLLTVVNYSDDKIHIEYNQNKQPIKITNNNIEEFQITWDDNGFTASKVSTEKGKEIYSSRYEMDSEGRITNYEGTSINWISTDSLFISVWDLGFKFDANSKSPLSSINMAIITLVDIPITSTLSHWSVMDDFQNNYCIVNCEEIDNEGSDVCKVSYVLNDDGYPISGELNYGRLENGVIDEYETDYVYYEYE